MNVHAVWLLALSALAVVGIVILAALSQPVPEVLTVIAAASTTGAAGASLPVKTVGRGD